MNVYGLDLSSSCSGLCLPSGETLHHQTPKNATHLEKALDTKRWLRDWFDPIGDPFGPNADLVVIEAIGTRFVNTAIAIAYIHCQVDELLQGTRVVKVSPAELKKFACGKGNATKHDMTVAAIRNGWACDSDEGSTDDECDAWWCWALGKALIPPHHCFPMSMTSYRTAVVDRILQREEAA